MLNQALKMIEEQQEKLKNSPAFVVGEQLKDMLRAEPHNAQLVVQDLQVPEMGLAQLEKKIRAIADKNRHGDMRFCGPAQAEAAIREFYGLTGREEQPVPSKPAGGLIDLADFM